MSALNSQLLNVVQSEARELGDGRVWLSGISATDTTLDVGTQTREVLAIADARLAERGVDRRAVLMVHIWLSDMDLFQDMTAKWNNWVGDLAPPSRSCVSGMPVIPGALLVIEVIALLPDAPSGPDSIKRFGLVSGPGRPTMCLALGYQDWFTVCTLASDCSVGVVGQTKQILDVFQKFMEEGGVTRSDATQLEIWLKDIDDLDAVYGVLVSWFGSSKLPAVSAVGANMAASEMLIEIRLTASVRARR